MSFLSLNCVLSPLLSDWQVYSVPVAKQQNSQGGAQWVEHSPNMNKAVLPPLSPSTQELEAGRSGKPELYNEFEASLDYMRCLSQNKAVQ